jgi:predicted nucleotidyltransferase
MQHKEQSAEFIAIDAALNKKQEQLRNENFNKEIEAAQKLADIKKQLAAESVETVIALLNYQFDNESNRIQQQMDEAEKKKEYDIKVAEATISNKQQRETEIAK